MLGTLLTLLATTLSLLVVDIIFSGVILANFPAAIVAALAIGLFNSGVKPVLSVLSLPINVLSLGTFTLVINGLCFWLASLFVPGFQVHGLLAFLVAPVILSSVNTFISNYFGEKYPKLTTSNKITNN
ncbi:MAG TPA: phage holin family protein [Coleofasciculaceae cyanobacterium]|jgi:putative membrane protein